MVDPARIGGILPVLYSYFDEGDALRPGAFAAQTRHCMESGAAGVVLFGFVTQFYRLTFAEKQAAMAETAAALEGGPGLMGVTVMEATATGQITLARAAEAAGADFVILQPPLAPPGCNPDWIRMVEAVAGATDMAVTIQNAALAGATMSPAQLVALQERCPNLVGVKAETSSAEIAAFARDQGDRFRVLTGNWGVEYPFFAVNGAHGLIPAPNFVPEQVAIHAELQPGGAGLDAALHRHARILPLMQVFRERPTVEDQVLLGKQHLAARIGLDPCVGRRPGPRVVDSALSEYAELLAVWTDRLPS